MAFSFARSLPAIRPITRGITSKSERDELVRHWVPNFIGHRGGYLHWWLAADGRTATVDASFDMAHRAQVFVELEPICLAQPARQGSGVIEHFVRWAHAHVATLLRTIRAGELE